MTKYLSISRLFLFDRSTEVAAASVSDDKSILDSMVLLCSIPTRLMTYHDEAHLNLASNDPFPLSRTSRLRVSSLRRGLPSRSPSYRHRLRTYAYDPISLLALRRVFFDLTFAIIDPNDYKQDLLQHRLLLPFINLAHGTGSHALASSECCGSCANDTARG
jgi:hypothetical protein